MAAPIGWIAARAARSGLRYEPDPDDRWLRAWEPYVTLKTPIRYEHALHATGHEGSLSLARMMVEAPWRVGGEDRTYTPSCWIALAQDARVVGDAACACDVGGAFAEEPGLVRFPRVFTGDTTFDRTFATFARHRDAAAQVGPSLRRLLLGWRIALHVELRPGSFILSPVMLPFDPPSLDWFLEAIYLFGDKAAKAALSSSAT